MRRRSLRLRLVVTFGLGAFVLSSLVATLTYVGVQRILISNQQQADLGQSYVNSALVRATLYSSPPELSNLLNSIQNASASNVLVRTHKEWLARSNSASTNDVSTQTVNIVDAGHATQQTLDVNGRIVFVVGVPIPSVETQFFEVFQLSNLEHTLRLLLIALIVGALATSLDGLSGGLWVARRTVRPLTEVSHAAALIADRAPPPPC